jgi:hypothetical protein
MTLRNPRANALGSIDGEIEHPQLGWVPFTAAAEDPEPLGRALFAAAIAGEFGPIAEYVPPPPAPPLVPDTISRRQLLIALATAGFITAEDAFAAAQTGAVPAAIAGIFDLLPTEQALAARITWATMTGVYREDPLINAIVAAGVASAEQVDDLFRGAAGGEHGSC